MLMISNLLKILASSNWAVKGVPEPITILEIKSNYLMRNIMKRQPPYKTNLNNFFCKINSVHSIC